MILTMGRASYFLYLDTDAIKNPTPVFPIHRLLKNQALSYYIQCASFLKDEEICELQNSRPNCTGVDGAFTSAFRHRIWFVKFPNSWTSTHCNPFSTGFQFLAISRMTEFKLMMPSQSDDVITLLLRGSVDIMTVLAPTTLLHSSISSTTRSRVISWSSIHPCCILKTQQSNPPTL